MKSGQDQRHRGQWPLVVNGANATIDGLFVEHDQQYQVLWNGNGGRVYFYPSDATAPGIAVVCRA